MANSNPVLYCTSCINLYVSTEKSYTNLMDGKDTNTNKPCKDEYYDTDRLNILEKTYQINMNLWNTANCLSKTYILYYYSTLFQK